LRLLSKIPAGPLRAIGEALPLIVLGLKGIGLARGAAAGLVGVAGLLSKVKGFGGLGRLGGAAAGELGGVALGKGVVPVYVTNKGFGGPGGGGLAGDLGKAGGGVAAGLSTTIAAAAAGALAIYFGSQYGSTKGQVNSNAAGDYIHQQMALNGQNYVGSPYGSRGYVSGTYVPQAIRGADYSGAKKAAQDYATTVVAAMATANRATAKYREELASLPKKVQTAVQTPGAVQSMSDVRALQHQYDLTPKQVRTLIQLLGGQQAINIAAAVQAKLDALHSKDISIRVNEIHAVSFGPHAKAIKQATGGHITGPGTGTSDSIPARLSNGEYVIRASAVKRYGVGLFDALNAERFASGGRVHRHHLSAAQRRHNQLLRDLALAQKLLGHTNATIGNAQSFGSAFAGNVFAAGLPTTKQVTVPGKTFTQVINGQLVTESTPATTKTVNLSQQQILANMLKYQRHQLAQARQVEHDVRKLRREGVSRSLLAQMQAGGAQGIAQIHALAQGSTAQVHQFNRLNAATNSALNNAGAYAAANQSMHHLQNRRANEESMVRAIRRALRHDGPIPVAVKRGKLRTV
ncbi:MAG TPA: hypothetical protein VFH38_00740, partial [Jatrophihabitans sp.]|nr:hypothetical protein [Jatrophihabitans sp.]